MGNGSTPKVMMASEIAFENERLRRELTAANDKAHDYYCKMTSALTRVAELEAAAQAAQADRKDAEAKSGMPLLWNIHCMFQQEYQGHAWKEQLRELLAAIDQHLVRENYVPDAALQAGGKHG